jgi:FkbM family methyltransferase
MTIVKNFINYILKIFNLKLFKIVDEFNNSFRLVLAFKEKKIDYIFDVGANEGQFVNEIRYYGYSGEILSFEPYIDAHKKILYNSKKDNKWKIYKPIALGNKEGQNKIYISKNSVSSSILKIKNEHIINAPDSMSISEQSTEENTLENIFNNLDLKNKTLFLKIDTQGYEFQVLKGAEKILREFKGILVEVSLVELYEGQKNWLEIVEFIQSNGFKLWSVDRGFTNKKNGQTLQLDLCFFK